MIEHHAKYEYKIVQGIHPDEIAAHINVAHSLGGWEPILTAQYGEVGTRVILRRELQAKSAQDGACRTNLGDHGIVER